MVKSIFTEEPDTEPDMMLDEEKLPISEEDVIDKTSELYFRIIHLSIGQRKCNQ